MKKYRFLSNNLIGVTNEFLEDFADKAEQIKMIVSETIQMVYKKEESTKIKKALNTLKNISIGVGENIIANSICGLITQLPIW